MARLVCLSFSSCAPAALTHIYIDEPERHTHDHPSGTQIPAAVAVSCSPAESRGCTRERFQSRRVDIYNHRLDRELGFSVSALGFCLLSCSAVLGTRRPGCVVCSANALDYFELYRDYELF